MQRSIVTTVPPGLRRARNVAIDKAMHSNRIYMCV